MRTRFRKSNWPLQARTLECYLKKQQFPEFYITLLQKNKYCRIAADGLLILHISFAFTPKYLSFSTNMLTLS